MNWGADSEAQRDASGADTRSHPAKLKRDKAGMKPSVKMVEITALRLQVMNLLKPVLTGIKMISDTFDAIVKS